MIRTAELWVRAMLVAALAVCLGACPGDGGRGSPQPPDGTVRAWGWNRDGQLGDGTTTNRWTPVQAVDPSDPTGFLAGVTAVAAGSLHTAALLGDGTLRAWGYNEGGQLGDGTTTNRWTPVQVVHPSDPTGFLTGVTAVAAGGGHTVAVLGDGTLRAWGYNGAGQLGDGTGTNRSTPVQVVHPSDPTGFLTGVTEVAAGSWYTVALLGDGTLRAWGGNLDGQLGDGTTMHRWTPVQVVDPSDPTGFLTGAAAVAAGWYHTVALLGDGTVRAWGWNFRGQLGIGTTSLLPNPIPALVVDPSDPTGFLTGVTAVA
ncbi:MAG: cell wall anchor protein, partial [Planctomycetota bacterium]|nr:cell wall anchor protein [Planctomycetota bacterium]